MEALYTIVHRVGLSADPATEAQLSAYTQRAFRIDNTRHGQLMSRANEEKVSLSLILFKRINFNLLSRLLSHINSYYFSQFC